MKKIIFLISMLIILPVGISAQQEVTKFLGIPVDGSKSEMMRKLKEKGFELSSTLEDALEGEFNGTDVIIKVVTNNNKVWRIGIMDKNNLDETNIKIRFNRLCQQFENNRKYFTPSDFTIPDDEDIAYEMAVHDKRYEAAYYQLPANMDSATIAKETRTFILENYTAEQLTNPSQELQKEMIEKSFLHLFDLYSKRSVWFMINQSILGGYYINMFYDNECNRANGEDL